MARSPLAAALVALFFFCAPVAAGAITAQELAGTWHVLVHFKDSATNNPETERWEDRIWVLTMEGDRLAWSEYPIVVFDDESGRFETFDGRNSRVLAYWEPSPGQQAEIAAGLQINPRGARNKTLRGSDEKGWTSAKKSGAGYSSARFITYEETWSIEGLPDEPVFTRIDSMGSASSESFDGQTVYTTTAIAADGHELSGTFNRDDARIGTFRMVRSGAARALKSKGDSQARGLEAVLGKDMAEIVRAAESGQDLTPEQLKTLNASGEFSDDDRRALGSAIAEGIADGMRDAGADPKQYPLEIRSLTEKVLVLYLDEGVPMDEIQQMIADGTLAP
jgi:hypothetical protein